MAVLADDSGPELAGHEVSTPLTELSTGEINRERFAGDNSAYYLSKWQALYASNRKISWNGSAGMVFRIVVCLQKNVRSGILIDFYDIKNTGYGIR